MGGGSNRKNHPWGGGYGYFLEPHIVSQGNGTVVSPSLAYLTVLANDDAFGIMGFNEVRQLLKL